MDAMLQKYLGFTVRESAAFRWGVVAGMLVSLAATALGIAIRSGFWPLA